jgi:hypothetical protein
MKTINFKKEIENIKFDIEIKRENRELLKRDLIYKILYSKLQDYIFYKYYEKAAPHYIEPEPEDIEFKKDYEEYTEEIEKYINDLFYNITEKILYCYDIQASSFNFNIIDNDSDNIFFIKSEVSKQKPSYLEDLNVWYNNHS